jgi:outer membrane protein OmpA-like peptidoglycan-associated protein
MAFNYERIRKKRESGGTEWTAYSDLFTGIAFMFLMMYVSTSLRSGTQGVQVRGELAQAKREAEDMREQMRAYDAIKNDYLERKASPEEESKIEDVTSQLDAKQSQLSQMAQDLKRSEASFAEKKLEAETLTKQLQDNERGYVLAMQELKASHDKAKKRKKNKSLQNIEKEKLSARARVEKEREYRKLVENRNRDYGEKLARINQNLETTKREIKNLAAEKSKYKNEAQQLAGDLTRAKAVANKRRELAKRIRESLNSAGVSANVDERTGDVILTFDNEYFETNEARLKPGMRKILDKFIPVYARSLFSDPKIAEEIKSVELVGFASPTHNNRYVDPASLSAADKKAVNYNIDLSYQRAKSIFNYIFDTNRIRYEKQDRLLSMVKVTGRSYLASKKDKVQGRSPASMNAKEFCRIYNCLESQRVIIKFNIEE